VRGGSAGDSGEALITRQGYINGLVYDPNAQAQPPDARADLLHAADMVRAGLAGSIRSYPADLRRQDRGRWKPSTTAASRPATPASRARWSTTSRTTTTRPCSTSTCSSCRSTSTPGPRARAGAGHGAINAFSQGVAYYHAGIDVLRSKSLDRNSFNSGDWFNRLDWTYRDNYFGTGLPPAEDNGKDYALLKPLLAQYRDSSRAGRHRLRARRLPRPAGHPRQLDPVPPAHRGGDQARLRFFNTGSTQDPTVIAAHLDGEGYAGRRLQGHQLLHQRRQGRRTR
jgi:pullulanase